MTTWMTAAELSERYIVGEDRLRAYSARGNLAMRKGPSGEALFDERNVALFFRPRQTTLFVARHSHGPSMGVLGLTKLGDQAKQPTVMQSHDPRDARRRALRIGRERVAEQVEARTGTHDR